MPKLNYRLADGRIVEVEVAEDFATVYNKMEHRERLIDRRETRRHQSLDKSVQHGFDVPDLGVNVLETVIRREEKTEIHNMLELLTDKQRDVLIRYTVHGQSFRAIGGLLNLSKVTVREYYLAAVKKIKKFF